MRWAESIGSISATKRDADPEPRVPTLFQNISCCSCRAPHPALSRRVGVASTHLILAAIARTSESADIVPGRDVHDRSCRIFRYLTDGLRTIFPQVAIVLQKDHRDEMVDARAGGRSKTRRENPL